MPLALDAAGAARAIAQGELTSETLVRACLERIAKREPTVKAWSWLDPDQAIRSARERDKEQAIGAPLGPLHGVPIGVKDVIDVAGMPTSCNSRIYEGYRPSMDAECVRVVRVVGDAQLVVVAAHVVRGRGLRPLKRRHERSQRVRADRRHQNVTTMRARSPGSVIIVVLGGVGVPAEADLLDLVLRRQAAAAEAVDEDLGARAGHLRELVGHLVGIVREGVDLVLRQRLREAVVAPLGGIRLGHGHVLADGHRQG